MSITEIVESIKPLEGIGIVAVQWFFILMLWGRMTRQTDGHLEHMRKQIDTLREDVRSFWYADKSIVKTDAGLRQISIQENG